MYVYPRSFKPRLTKAFAVFKAFVAVGCNPEFQLFHLQAVSNRKVSWESKANPIAGVSPTPSINRFSTAAPLMPIATSAKQNNLVMTGNILGISIT